MSQHLHTLWSRRTFLKTALVGVALLGSRLVLPDEVAAQPVRSGRLRLFNRNTHERITVRYRTQSGRYDQRALQDLNYVLRCHHSDQVCEMDLQLLDNLNRIVNLVGPGKEVHVFSAYRSPTYNDWLVRTGKGAAPNSLHTTGQALDISIPGVRLTQVWRAAAKLRQGGVGNYRRRGFIHIDTGSVRFW